MKYSKGQTIYEDFIDHVSGKIIYINPFNQSGRINPLEILPEADREKAVKEGVERTKKFIEVNGSHSLTDNERNAIEKVILSGKVHTINSFYENLIQLEENGYEGLTSLIKTFEQILGKQDNQNE